MAQPFQNAIITNDGARLLTRAQAGEIKIEFTRIAIGDGQYEDDDKEIGALQNQTTLKSEQNSYPLSAIDIFSDHSVKITALIANQNPVTGEILVDNGYFINEMGLFAKVKDGAGDTEILYSIAVTTGTNGDFMPPFNGYYPVHILQEYYATVNNSAQVTIQAGIGAAILNEDYLKLKSDVGNVDITKGDLQTQLNRLVENLGNPSDTENPDGGIKFADGIEATDIIGAINEVFRIGNEKKSKLVDNLVAMGVPASTDETWEELLNKVLDMTDTSKDTVTASVLLEEYTAHDAAGAQITGAMPERASVTVDTTGVTQDSSYTYFGVPEGHYDENSKVRAINSDLGNRVVKLGSSTSYNLKTYQGWEKFAINKNIFLTSSTSIRVRRSGNVAGWSFDQTFTSKPSATYANGILTIASGNGSHVFVESGEAGNVRVDWTNTWEAYLVY